MYIYTQQPSMVVTYTIYIFFKSYPNKRNVIICCDIKKLVFFRRHGFLVPTENIFLDNLIHPISVWVGTTNSLLYHLNSTRRAKF